MNGKKFLIKKKIFYLTNPYLKRVGRPDAAVPQDILLIGTHILSEHCILSNSGNELVELKPCNSALCYVNGKQVDDTVSLKSGDRVIFGKSHVFRYNNPEQARKEKKLSSPVTPVNEGITNG